MQAIFVHLAEELLIALMSPEQTNAQNPKPVCREQSPDRVEFRLEDLEDDEREGELRQGRSNVGAFEGPLGGADLHNFLRGQHHRRSAVLTQMIPVGGMRLKIVKLA